LVELTQYGFAKTYQTLNLWTKGPGCIADGRLESEVAAHDCLLLRLD